MIGILSSQGGIFLALVLAGFALGFLYDFFRIMRRALKIKRFWTSVSDIFFWAMAVMIIFVVLFYTNYGQIRGFVFLAAVLGATLYFLVLSPKILPTATKAAHRAAFAVKKSGAKAKNSLRKQKKYVMMKVAQKMSQRKGRRKDGKASSQ